MQTVGLFVTLLMGKNKKINQPKKLKDPWTTGQKVAFGIFLAVVILVGIPVGIYAYYAYQGKETFAKTTTFTYEGKTYTLGNDVVTILVMGIDNDEADLEDDRRNTDDEIIYIDQDGNEYATKGGRVDMCYLVILDKSSGAMSLVNINRDAMTEVNICTTWGDVYLTDTMQLTLAYSYGDGGTVSCENFVTAVSNMFGGLPIDKYIAIDLDGMGAINDAVNGATVLPKETISADIFLYESITLAGDQARTYVEKVEFYATNPGAHLERMTRQNEYVIAFLSSLLSTYSREKTVLKDLYEAALPYIQTNITRNDLLYLAYFAWGMDFNIEEITDLTGEYTRGEFFDELIEYRESVAEILEKYFQ